MFARAEGVVVASRYRLVRKLGTGGMGSVWLARDLLLDSNCALKLVDDDKAQTEEVRVRFQREAKVAAQLRGAHVVDVFDHGEWSGVPYIAMEYLEGEDLGSRLDRIVRLDAETTYRFVAHVARALVRAHACGTVHRDLKPENVFLVEGDEGEIAKVLDFGIAKHDAYSLQDKATKTGSFLGTPFYVSPEQARGKVTDHRSDLWSLGVIAFQCLTGRPPFESEALGELMGMILYDDIPKPSSFNPALSPAVDDWWAKASARDREQRFQSGKELTDALGEALGVGHVVAVPSVSPRHMTQSEEEIVLVPGSDGRETDAPFSSTNRTSIPVEVLLTVRPRLRRAINISRRWLRKVPRRHLVGVAVFSGIAAGTVITLWITSSDPEPAVSAPTPPLGLESPAPAARGEPTPTVFPREPAPTSAETEEPPSASGQSSSSATPAASLRLGPRMAPPKKPPVKGGPRDYGI